MIKKLWILSLLALVPFLMGSSNYTYSYYDEVLHSAPGMTFATYFNQTTLNTTLSSPEDLAVYNNQIYLIDSNTNALTIVNDNFQLIDQITTFALSTEYQNSHQLSNDHVETLNNPLGLDVKPSGIYIADTSNNRIVKLNHDFEVIEIFDNIEDSTFEELNFEPRKLTVDASERMYVVARNVYEGIIELDSDGSFNRFTGVNPINLNPIEVLRRSLMTEEQLAQLQLYLPTEYTNVNIDHRSFIYATSRPSDGSSENSIQLINPKGVDVLKRNGYHAPMGDIHYIEGENNHVISGPSLLQDIAWTENGIYTVLDQRRSRLFTYDREGNLLYVNGDEGAQSDKFTEGVAVEYLKDDLLVLDRRSRTVIVYRLTEFGEAVNLAVSHHEQGEFEAAADVWKEVIKLNTNYEIAYNGIGKYYLRIGDFETALEYFTLGHDHFYYSKAFQGYRNTIIKENFGLITFGVVGSISLLLGLKVYRIYKKGGSIMYED